MFIYIVCTLFQEILCLDQITFALTQSNNFKYERLEQTMEVCSSFYFCSSVMTCCF